MRTSILHRGDSFRFKITLKDSLGGILDWDSLSLLEIRIFAQTAGTTLKTFTKADLEIPVPALGIAYCFLSGPVTEHAIENAMYIFEYKYKYGSEEKSRKGYLGTFIKAKMETQHF